MDFVWRPSKDEATFYDTMWLAISETRDGTYNI